MTSKNQLNSYQVLQEFRDLCSLAVEHFDEQILPAMKRTLKDVMESDCYRPTPSIATFLVKQQFPSGKDQVSQQNRALIVIQQNLLVQLKAKV